MCLLEMQHPNQRHLEIRVRPLQGHQGCQKWSGAHGRDHNQIQQARENQKSAPEYGEVGIHQELQLIQLVRQLQDRCSFRKLQAINQNQLIQVKDLPKARELNGSDPVI